MKILIVFLLCILLTGCGAKPELPAVSETVPKTTASAETEPTETTIPETEPPDPVGEILAEMSTEEKVGQLFLARCDDARALQDIPQYHLGGFVLFGEDFDGQTVDSMQEKLSAYQAAADIPLLLAVDEEGGTVCRVSRYPAFRDARFPSPEMPTMQEDWLGH